MATPHISAEKQDIAKVVLMAGDPLRAKLWAERYLTNPRLVNSVRNMYAFTGEIEPGKEITVMGHGMGLESIGIYAFELYKFYDVETIIRFGSCGLYDANMKVKDVIICDKAWTNSNWGEGYGESKDTLEASADLVKVAQNAADRTKPENRGYVTATAHSSPWFYADSLNLNLEELSNNNIKGVEMEAYALYLVANVLNRKALTILTASDHLITDESLSSKERETGFDWMFEICKEIAKEV